MAIAVKGRDDECQFDSGWAFFLHNESGLPNNLVFCGHYDSGGSTAANMTQRLSSSNTINTGVWQHVAVTWDGTKPFTSVHLYINGAETTYDDSNGINGATARTDDSARPFRIGNSIVSQYFNGAIDDVRIYNRALSGEEIKRLYNMGR